jgi:hypothetical protein
LASLLRWIFTKHLPKMKFSLAGILHACRANFADVYKMEINYFQKSFTVLVYLKCRNIFSKIQIQIPKFDP